MGDVTTDGRSMRVRLGPADEYMHPGPEPTFNESMYVNLIDPLAGGGAGVAGFVRIGNRPNEGHAEMTVCLYLPDGRVAFMFKRPEIDGNERFEAGGASIEVVEPFVELRVGYRGRLVLLEDPLEMADPRTAFGENPYGEAELRLTVHGASDPCGGEPEGAHERPGEEFARGHYEQLVRVTGSVRLGGDHWQVDGRGLRDHSWGPRTWQAPWYYRWLTVNLDDGTGMMLSRIARPPGAGTGTRGGFVWDGTSIRAVQDVAISTEWQGQDCYHERVHARFTVRDAAGTAVERSLTGTVRNLIPLRNRRDGRITRISEGLTAWELDRPLVDGGATTGHGLSEYLDQIVGGGPVGVDE
jgi:hypothetical protein